MHKIGALARRPRGAPVQRAASHRRVIARRLGMTPESFSRAIAALEGAGAIRVEGRSIAVLRRAALERAAGAREA